MNARKLIPLLIISIAFSQFYDVEVEISGRNIKESQKYILHNFTTEIENYFISNNFSSEYDYLDIPLKIQFIIESISDNSNNIIISSQVLISNYGDLYYYSGLTFPYHEGKSFNYNPLSFDSLTSFLNFYAYLFIGYELDTYGLNLGSDYFVKSLDISDEMRFSNYSRDWEKRKGHVKDIRENIQLRNIRYIYYDLTDKILENNENLSSQKINESVNEIYNLLTFIFEKIGYEKNTLKFLDSKGRKIATLFHNINIERSINFLILFDEKNELIYKEFLDQ